jgi:predicted Zn-dependent protease
MKKHILLIIVCCAIFQDCAVNPVTGKRQLMLLSKDQEVSMGKEADPDIVATYGLYPSPELQKFINQKGQQMAKLSHRPDLPYEFKILDSPIVNAFAVPGGYVYFTRGIMAHLNSEAEFAGVLGHEIGHIAARHSAQQYSKQMVAQVGLAVGSIVSPTFARFSDIAQTGAGLLFLKYGRDAERQSDELGVEYSTKIGYDAKQMAKFFLTLKRMQQSSGGEQIPVFMSTHPDPGERNEKVAQLADQWQKKTNGSSYAVSRNNYLKMIDGIIYGDDPKQGYVDGQVFFHPELKFSFPVPQGWQIENTPQQVNMAPSSGDAVIIFSLEQASSLGEAAEALVSRYGLSVKSSQRNTINGLNSIRILATQASQGQEVYVVVHLIDYNNTIYDFIAATTAQRLSAYEPVADKVAQGFARLTDPARINVEPKRINIVEVQSRASLNQTLASFGITSDKMEEHAVLNGMELADVVSAGMLIKIISGNRPAITKR